MADAPTTLQHSNTGMTQVTEAELPRMMERLAQWMRACLLRLDRVRLLMIFAIDASQVMIACVLTLLLQFDFSIPPQYGRVLKFALIVWPVSKLAVFALVGTQRRSWRQFSHQDLLHLVGANTLASLVAALVLVPLHIVVPRSILVIDLLLCTLATAGPRLFARALSDFAPGGPTHTRRRRVLIYGAGSDGIALLRELRRTPSLKYDVCGFIDDSPRKQGLVLHGVRVLGRGSELRQITSKCGIQLVLIAIPSASGSQMSRILDQCRTASVESKTVSTIAERIGAPSGLATQLRDVSVEDLLGRSPVRLEEERIAHKVAGRVVLVTGAAGSIGSELCRQIARFRPHAIVGFEIAESPLFQLQQEMRRLHPDVRFYPAIGSIQSTQRLDEVFAAYRPAVVYHAAAYKHVPMMEAHVYEAIENNVFGTLNVALAADRHGVEDFVMISSDKAVRPTNIMGATKRVAELVIRSLQSSRVKYVSVRFGNVLGSNGSVVPIFKEQIARGGPVTVTHPEMRRYFMTIPEACQLVLQASTMGRGGEIFVLDMGKPVRIVDLARNLILLSGLRPDEDIAIEFTGVRPGEKLYEELSAANEHTIPTYHEKIQIFVSPTIPANSMEARLADLRNACSSRNLDNVVLELKEIAPEYNPSSDLLRQVFRPKHYAIASSVAAQTA